MEAAAARALLANGARHHVGDHGRRIPGLIGWRPGDDRGTSEGNPVATAPPRAGGRDRASGEPIWPVTPLGIRIEKARLAGSDPRGR